MKKRYETPEAEKLAVVSEAVMQSSAEEEILDNEQNDNEQSVWALLRDLQNRS